MKIQKKHNEITKHNIETDFSDRELREAARILSDSMVEYVDKLPYTKKQFREIPSFIRTSASYRNEIPKKRKKFHMQLAAVFAIIFFATSSVIYFNDDVVAAAKRLVKVKIIREINEDNLTDSLSYSPSWIPDGFYPADSSGNIRVDKSEINIADFIKIERIANKGMKSYSYKNDNGDSLDINIFFSESDKRESGDNNQEYADNSNIEKIELPKINGMTAAQYSSKDNSDSYIVLRDKLNGLTFIISGNIGIDEMKKVAEEIKE